MGITFIQAKIKNPEKPSQAIDENFLVDSGASFSVVPKQKLFKLGIKPHRQQEFVLADGTQITRKIGDAIFEINNIRASSPVVFGEKGDSSLLGTFSLEALGLILDPFKRELRPMKLLMV